MFGQQFVEIDNSIHTNEFKDLSKATTSDARNLKVG